jgi:hypothetical protein
MKKSEFSQGRHTGVKQGKSITSKVISLRHLKDGAYSPDTHYSKGNYNSFGKKDLSANQLLKNNAKNHALSERDYD